MMYHFVSALDVLDMILQFFIIKFFHMFTIFHMEFLDACDAMCLFPVIHSLLPS